MEYEVDSAESKIGEILLRRWLELVRPFGGEESAAQGVFEELAEAYNEPGRYYHTLTHVQHVLETIDSLQAGASNLPAIRFAAWFHDAIYDSKAKDNEEKSAELASVLLPKLAIPTQIIDSTVRLILCTKQHQADPGDHDAHILLDADLAILAADPTIYQKYAQAIRQEYAWVAEEQYRVGRKQVLQKFLQRERIYFTPLIMRTGEQIARHNLITELKIL